MGVALSSVLKQHFYSLAHKGPVIKYLLQGGGRRIYAGATENLMGLIMGHRKYLLILNGS